MNYLLKLSELISSCESFCNRLAQLNPNHELLIYDGTGMSPAEFELFTDLFIANFAPAGADNDTPSTEELLMAYESYRSALEAAVAIELAKAGQFRPME